MDNLDHAQEAIRKGERARILVEILASEIGCDLEYNSIWKKLTEVDKEYNDAITSLAYIMQRNSELKKTQPHEEKTGDTYTNGDYK